MASLVNTLPPETCCGSVALCDTRGKTRRSNQGQVGLCWKGLSQHTNEVLLRTVVSEPTYLRATAGAYRAIACLDVLHGIRQAEDFENVKTKIIWSICIKFSMQAVTEVS